MQELFEYVPNSDSDGSDDEILTEDFCNEILKPTKQMQEVFSQDFIETSRRFSRVVREIETIELYMAVAEKVKRYEKMKERVEKKEELRKAQKKRIEQLQREVENTRNEIFKIHTENMEMDPQLEARRNQRQVCANSIAALQMAMSNCKSQLHKVQSENLSVELSIREIEKQTEQQRLKSDSLSKEIQQQKALYEKSYTQLQESLGDKKIYCKFCKEKSLAKSEKKSKPKKKSKSLKKIN